MDKEIWCDVKGYEGLYQVSNWGRVKSLNYNHTGKEKLLRPGKDGWDYLFVYLWKGGERKRYKIHRLVLSTFNPIENMENLDCNHLDENKENNHLSNLEWTTHKENCNHGTRNARVSEKNTNGKNSTPIVQLNLDGKYIRSYKSSMDAQRLGGFNPSNIIKCCKNKYMRDGNNIYKGYRFMYLSEYMDKYCGIID